MATVRVVLLGTCAAGVLHFFAVFGVVAPMLALEASDRLFFVFVWFESLQVDTKSLVNDPVGCLWGG